LSRPQPLVLAAAIFIALSILGGLFWVNWLNSMRSGSRLCRLLGLGTSVAEFDATPYGELASANAQLVLGRTRQIRRFPVLGWIAAYSESRYSSRGPFRLCRGACRLDVAAELALLGTGVLPASAGGGDPPVAVVPRIWCFVGACCLAAHRVAKVVILAQCFLLGTLVALHGDRDEWQGSFCFWARSN
jgi:hypothetical protein